MRRWILKLLPMTTAMMICVCGLTAAATASVRVHHSGSPPSWWVKDALCVHHYEGSWTDSGAPFWGGMQMNYGFQYAYGRWALNRWGTADHWPISVQLLVAYQGWKARGWWPWPNTARYCHLL